MPEIQKLTEVVKARGRLITISKSDYPNLGKSFKNSDKPYSRRMDNGQQVRLISTTRLGRGIEEGTYIKPMNSDNYKNDFNTWKSQPSEDFGNIKVIEVIVKADNRTGDNGSVAKAPVFVYNNLASADWAAANLGDLAAHGVLTSIAKGYFEEIKGYTPAEREEVRDFMRPYNAHNDKLGFDFSNVKRKLIALKPDSQSKQFAGSTYPKFLASAVKFLKEAGGFEEYVNHLQDLS